MTPAFAIERRPRRKGVRLIALTPLIDMVFILLIFFMLQSSFIDWRALELRLGGAGPAAEPLVLTVARDGSVSLAGQRVPRARLEAVLRAQAAAGRRGGIGVVPHDDLPFAALVPVLDAAAAAGAGPVTLIRGAQ